jgi:tetratricopeptide (TPR) repeat protein
LGDESNEIVGNLIANLSPPPGENAIIIKYATTQALSHVKNNPRVIDALIQTYQNNENISVRLGCIWALGSIGNNTSRNLLEYIIKKGDSEEVRAAQSALELFGKGSFEQIQSRKEELDKKTVRKGFFSKIFGSNEKQIFPKESSKLLQCSSCGNKVMENAKFCGNCGAAITSSMSGNSVPVAAPSSPPQSGPNNSISEGTVDWVAKGADILIDGGPLDEAIKYFDKAININPNDDGAWRLKGVSLIGCNDSEALYCLETALKINSDVADSWFEKGRALGNLERYDEALKCFDTSIMINPDHYTARCEKGEIYLKLHRFNEALISFDNAIKINPNVYNGVGWHGKGLALNGLKKFDEALTCFDNAINISDDYRFWIGKAIAYRGLNRSDDANKCIRTAIEIEPDLRNHLGL